MKSVKLLLSVLAGLVALLAVAAIAITLFLDPNEHKERIAGLVETHTGRSLKIKEDISLSLFPWLGVRLGALELGNAPGFGAEPFARVVSVQVKVKLLPLLRQQLEVDTVTIQGLGLNLARDKNGKGNWEDLQKTGKPAEPAAGEPAKPGTATGSGAAPGPAVAKPLLAAWAVNGLELTDADISWRDDTNNTHQKISGLTITLGGLTEKRPIPLEVALTQSSADSPVANRITLSGQVTLNLAAQRYRLEVTKLAVASTGTTLPEGRIDLTAGFALDADLAAQRLELVGLHLETIGARVTGEAHGSDILGEPRFHGTLSLPAFNPRETFRILGAPPPVTADPQVLRSASAELKFAGGADSLAVDELLLILDKARVTGNLKVDGFSAPKVAWRLDLDAIDLDRYLPPKAGTTAKADPGRADTGSSPARTGGGKKGAPPPAGEPPPALAALATLNMDGALRIKQLRVAGLSTRDIDITVNARDGVLRLAPLGLGLYRGKLSGSATLDARRATPSIRVQDLRLAGLNAGELLKDLNGDTTTRATVNLTADLAASGLDAEAIKRSLTGKALVTLDSIRADRFTVERLGFTATIDKEAVTLAPIDARLYKGSITGGAIIDIKGPAPRITLKNLTLRQVQAEPLLRDLTGKAPVSGQADLTANLSMVGADAAAIQGSLSGDVRFAFNNGAIRGMNIPRMIRNGYNLVKGQPLEPDDSFQQTDFSRLTASARINKGVVDNQDLEMTSPLLRVRGRGRIDLPRDRIDYTAETGVVGTLTGQGGKPIEELKGVTIPVRITGAIANPKMQPDYGSLGIQLLKNDQVKGKAIKEVDRFLDKNEELKKLLPGIDGGKLLKGLGF